MMLFTKQRVNLILISCFLIISPLGFFKCNRGSNPTEDNTGISTDSLNYSVQNSRQNELKSTSKTDSLKILMDGVKSDTSRLRILDALAYIENNDSLCLEYNQQIKVLTQKILSENPSPNEEKICKKYLAEALHRDGLIYANQSDYTQAMECYQKSIKYKEEIGDKSGISTSLNYIGHLYYLQNEYNLALKYYNESLKIREELNDKAGTASSLNNIANIYADQGDYDTALNYYNKCLSVFEKLGDKENFSKILTNIGIIYEDRGNIPEALKYYKNSLKITEELGDKVGMAILLNSLGNIYNYQDNILKALEHYNKCLSISEELGNKRLISLSLYNFGQIYYRQADFAKALEYFNKSLAIHEEMGNKIGIANDLSDIGIIYSEQNDLEKALEFHSKSLELKEALGDKMGISESLINIGNIYAFKKEFTKALDCYNRSLIFKEELKDKAGITKNLTKIGDIYFIKNETDKALNYAKRSYNLAKETNIVSYIGDAAELFEKIYTRQGKYKLARQYLDEYITMRDSINKLENQKMAQKIYYQYQYEKKAIADSIDHSKEMEISNLKLGKQRAESHRQRLVIVFVVTGLLLMLIIAGVIFRSLRITRKQKNIIEFIHGELTDSIHYAERIQKAVLPSPQKIKDILADYVQSANDYFILFKPRDIVSGDFYFFGKRKNILQIAVADCTGHGVPGAFMSMLGVSLLNQIISQDQALTAGQILDELRRNTIHSLQQKGISGEQQDGMDIAFVSFDTDTKILQFAGAYNPLFIISKNKKELTEIKADRMPVGISENTKSFINHSIRIRKGDIIYMASDGYQDQFGGPKGKKFFSKRLKELLTEICHMPMPKQKDILDKTIEEWKNNYSEKFEQTDDITILGIKLS